MGEFTDKAVQSELQELEGTIQESQRNENSSVLKELLDKLPDGLFGGKDEKSRADELQANAAAAQMQNAHISPREPEEWTNQLQEITKQIYPIMEFHDEIMSSITETMENIPILPDLIDEISEQVSLFVFSLLAPFVLPVIGQVKQELQTGSTTVIKSSKDKQHIVFEDDSSTDPTHSMLSKDHFTNVLNEPAGKVASQVLKWVVPQIVDCWDNDGADVDRTLRRIVAGVFHHPALREQGEDGARDGRTQMFGVVESWWHGLDDRQRDDMRRRLDRSGVEQGRNHKEGMHDSGHGCGKPLSIPGRQTSGSSGTIGGASQMLGGLLGQSSSGSGGSAGKAASDAVGGGVVGGIVGGIVGEVLGGGDEPEKRKAGKKQHQGDGGLPSTTYGQSGTESYQGQSQYGQTQAGAYGGGGYGAETRTETRKDYYGGGGGGGGGYESQEKTSQYGSGGYESK